jgi:hypothetical protein
MGDSMFPFWRTRYAMYIGMIIMGGLFELNYFRFGWNIIVGLVVTAVLFVLSEVIGGGTPFEDSAERRATFR